MGPFFQRNRGFEEALRGITMKRIKKAFGVAALVVDLTLVLTGCIGGVVDLGDDYNDSNHSGQAEATAASSRTVGLVDQTTVQVEGTNGAIRIWGVEGLETVEVAAIRRVRSNSHQDAFDHLSELQVLVETRPAEILIKTLQPQQSFGRTYAVDYDITVPPHLIHEVYNGNGSVRLEGVSADVEVKNGNGDVTLEDVVGSSHVTVGNGKISARTFLPEGGQIVHSAGNGSILLSLQPQVSASFGAKVGNGTISLSGLDLQGILSTPRELQGTLGAGTGTIQLALGNGQIRVEGG